MNGLALVFASRQKELAKELAQGVELANGVERRFKKGKSRLENVCKEGTQKQGLARLGGAKGGAKTLRKRQKIS